MYKGNDVIGKPIITYDTGAMVEKIKDVLFDAPKKRILGFLIGEAGVFAKAKILPFANVRSIGSDAVTVDNDSAIVEATDESRMEEAAKTENIAKGTKVMTEDGKDLGSIADLYFDEKTGEIKGYEVSGGVFADAYSGKSFLPAPQTLKIGEEVAFVPPETAKMMEEQVGGIKGAVQSAASQAGKMTGDAIGKVQDAAQGAKQAVLEQGGKVSAEQLVGRRVHKAVYGEDGSIVAAEGQIITEPTLMLARQHGKEAALAGAVMAGGAKAAGEKAGQVADAAGSAWQSIKGKATELTEMAAGKVEEKRIKAALGKPVTKVILDKSDKVILNTGDLVTNEAVEQAREEGVLDMLLNSVTADTPKFESDELKSKRLDSQQ